MGILEYIIIIIIILLLFVCVYRIADLSNKLTRIRKRYDNLLRGKGELNLEDLLASQALDIEVTKEMVETIKFQNESLNENINKKSNILTKQVEEDLQEVDSRLSTTFSSFNDEIKSRLVKLERFVKENTDNINEKVDNSLRNMNENLDKRSERHEQDIQRKIKIIADQAAFSVQRVAHRRYNALENQSGDLSFTVVLLNQLNSGIMITSINGRDSSYTYSKNIKNGKPESECSEQELLTLDEALNVRE